MRKIFLLWLLVPLMGLSQAKNVINVTRIFPKSDKILELEKALASHSQRYHTGDWKWRVFEIQSGPDAGGYHITEGPNSWEALDKRGDLGAEHTADWAKNVSPLTTGLGSQSYSVYDSALSTVQITDYADKILISRLNPKPGMVGGTLEIIKKMTKVWQAGNESVAVYATIGSGGPQYAMVTRMKAGLKELDPAFRKPMPERYSDVYGAGAWDYYLADYAKIVESRWSELLFLRADLSSK
jgi:hypothetical protein